MADSTTKTPHQQLVEIMYDEDLIKDQSDPIISAIASFGVKNTDTLIGEETDPDLKAELEKKKSEIVDSQTEVINTVMDLMMSKLDLLREKMFPILEEKYTEAEAGDLVTFLSSTLGIKYRKVSIDTSVMQIDLLNDLVGEELSEIIQTTLNELTEGTEMENHNMGLELLDGPTEEVPDGGFPLNFADFVDVSDLAEKPTNIEAVNGDPMAKSTESSNDQGSVD
jgi:hypothetical protein